MRWIRKCEHFFLYVYKSILDGAILQFAIAGVLFAFIFPARFTPDEESHYLAGLTNYASLFKFEDSYCGFARSAVSRFTGEQESLGSQAFQKSEDLEKSCSKTITYGWKLNYPSVILASLLTTDSSRYPNQVLLKFYLSRIINGFLMLWMFCRLGVMLKRYGYRPGISFLLLFLISPIFLQQTWSITADVPVNLLGMQLALLVLYYPRLTKIDLISFVLISFVACSSKPMLAPLIPVMLLSAHAFHDPDAGFSRAFFQKILKDRFFQLGLVSSVLGIAIGFLQIGVEKEKGHSRIAEQLAFIFANPGLAFKAMNDVLAFFFGNPKYFFIGSLGYYKVHTPAYMEKALEQALYFVAFLECGLLLSTRKLQLRQIVEAKARSRLAFLGASITLSSFALYVSTLLPVFIMYLSWTKVGSTAIEGVQARYFFPMLFCGLGLVFGLLDYFLKPREPSLAARPGNDFPAPSYVLTGVLCILMICFWTGMFRDIITFYYKP